MIRQLGRIRTRLFAVTADVNSHAGQRASLAVAQPVLPQKFARL